jgi:ATP-dependent exoDNAse (exonuclease V) alpha subunit
VFRKQTIAIAIGDQIRITSNFKSCGVRFVNNELLKVLDIREGRIKTAKGEIDTAQPVHIDQGVAVTSHAAQGKTVDQVIVSAPVASFAQVNQAQFYVSMSRARRAMHLFTDSKVALKEAVTKKSERLSPLESAISERVHSRSHEGRSNNSPVQEQHRTKENEYAREY